MELQNINHTSRSVVKVCEASIQQATEQDVNCEHFLASSCNSRWLAITSEYVLNELLQNCSHSYFTFTTMQMVTVCVIFALTGSDLIKTQNYMALF